MFTQPKKDESIINFTLIILTSLVSAGAIIFAWQFGITYRFDFKEQFLLIVFCNIEFIAAVFIYHRATERRLIQALLSVLLTPIFIIILLLLIRIFARAEDF